MGFPWESFFAELLGAGAASAGFFGVARVAFKNWLDHKAKIELENLRGQLARDLAIDLEKDRQKATASIESSRQQAAESLERLKSVLVTDIEVRRAAATRKVDALLALVTDADRVADALRRCEPGCTNILNATQRNTRELEALLLPANAARLEQYVSLLGQGHSEIDRTQHDPGVGLFREGCLKLERARDELLALVRDELGVSAADAGLTRTST